MTIEEMRAWLARVEPDPAASAFRQAFEAAASVPENASALAVVIEPLKGTDDEIYCLSLGQCINNMALMMLFPGLVVLRKRTVAGEAN
jgi:hypothetical protein